jgi:ligand-binding sensor domain-containing protein
MAVASASSVRVGRNTEVSRSGAVAGLVLLYLLALLIGAHSTAHASTDAPTAQPMRFAHYDRDDGLSQSAVNQIIQDSSGFMWFATESGLNRFDGYEFTVYRRIRGEAGTMPNDFITDVALDNTGDLWITTDGGGLIRRHANSIKLDVYRNESGNPGSLIDDNLRRVLADPRGWIWVGTMRHGLSRMDAASGEIVVYRHDDFDAGSISDDRVYALWLDADGSLWIGTGNGLDRLDPESGDIKHYPINSSGGDDDVRVLAIRRDSRGDLWVGTAEHGLVRLDETDGSRQVYRHDAVESRSLASDRVEVIYEDSAGRLWIGTNNGLHLMSAERSALTRYRHDPTDPSVRYENRRHQQVELTIVALGSCKTSAVRQ